MLAADTLDAWYVITEVKLSQCDKINKELTLYKIKLTGSELRFYDVIISLTSHCGIEELSARNLVNVLRVMTLG